MLALRKMNPIYGDALTYADQCSVDCDAHFGMSPDYRDAIQAQRMKSERSTYEYLNLCRIVLPENESCKMAITKMRELDPYKHRMEMAMQTDDPRYKNLKHLFQNRFHPRIRRQGGTRAIPILSSGRRRKTRRHRRR